MSRLNVREAVKIYSLVLLWSFFLFWAGLTLGNRRIENLKDKDSSNQLFEDPVFFNDSSVLRGSLLPKVSQQDQSQETFLPEKDEVRKKNNPSFEIDLQKLYYTVQVAALETEREGKELIKKLLKRQHNPRLVPPASTGGFYRVWLGKCAEKEAAKKLEIALRNHGFSTYVRQVSRDYFR